MPTTNLLIERINSIKTAGESFKNSNLLKSRKQEIEAFLIPFNETESKLENISNSFQNLAEINPDINVSFSQIKDSLLLIKNKVNRDEFDRVLLNSIKRELDLISNDLLKRWKEYIAEKTSAIDGVLETLKDLITDTAERQTLTNKRNIFIMSSIGSAAALKAIDEYISTYEVLMSKLNLKDSVLEFLRLLTSGGPVSLRDMSPDVYEWIIASGFAGKINIGIGMRR